MTIRGVSQFWHSVFHSRSPAGSRDRADTVRETPPTPG